VAPTQTARPGLTQDTVDTLSGRQSGLPSDANQSASKLAATNRITFVLEQYIQALVNADADAIREYRAALSPEETALMRARQLKVRLEDVRVEVNGAEATARCRRKVEGTSATGSRIQEESPIVFRLTRRASGWVITDVR
jgi:ketosteroid isomerase-like protein